MSAIDKLNVWLREGLQKPALPGTTVDNDRFHCPLCRFGLPCDKHK